MIDITLAVIGKLSTHSLPTEKEGGRWKPGQIQSVHRSEDVADLADGDYHMRGGIGSDVLVFIHIRQVPGTAAKKMRDLVLGVIEEGGATKHRSQFRLKPADMPPAFKAKLLAEKEATANWSGAKIHLKHAVTETPIQDGDIE